MTARSELFVNEGFRDYIIDWLYSHSLKRERGLKYGKDWHDVEIPKEWRDIWDELEYPTHLETYLVDKSDKRIAKVSADILVAYTNTNREVCVGYNEPDITISKFKLELM